MSESIFPDPNLALAVLQSLVDEGHVPVPDWDAVEPTKPHDEDPSYQSKCIRRFTDARDALLTILAGYPAALPELTDLRWDLGQDAQRACHWDWDVADYLFEVDSLAGIDRCSPSAIWSR